MNRTLLFIFLYVTSFVFSQKGKSELSVGLESNSQYYIDDKVTGDFEEENNFRSNNYLKIDYKVSDFSFGVQLESYAPQSLLNYSPNFDSKFNVGTFSANYRKNKWDITLGHFYEQLGSGLILRSWEDRQLGINNAILGGRISFNPTEKIGLTALYGKQRVGFKISDGQLFGLDTNFDLSSDSNSLQMGLSYVGRYQEVTTLNTDFNPLTHAVSGRVQFLKNNFYTNLEAVYKTKDALVEDGIIFDNKLFKGNAFVMEFGYSKKGFGVTTTLRRMENMNFFTDREASGNTYNEQIVNYIPGLTKQHDYGLTNIYVYQAQPGLSFNPLKKAGEIGGQIDLYYSMAKGTKLGGKYGTKLAINFSKWNGLEADYNPDYRRINVGDLDFGENYFRDFNLEVRKKLSKKTSLILAYVNSFYNKTYVEERIGEVNSNILVVDATYKFSRKQSVRIDVQHLWTKEDKQNWMAGTAEFNLNSHLSLFATDMYNYGNNDESHRDHYFLFGGSFTKKSSRFALSYGRQRGGLLCVGGVCREVPAATGFTFNVITSF